MAFRSASRNKTAHQAIVNVKTSTVTVVYFILRGINGGLYVGDPT